MIRSLLLFCLRFFKSRTQLQLEIVYLRKQLEILTRTASRPRFRPSERFFFSVLTHIFSSWQSTLLIIKPETVIRWHQQGFRLYWRWKSRSELGRPKIPQEQIDLIKQIANDNPLWGAPRIHGEMLKLGSISQNLPCCDTCPRNPRDLPANTARHFSRITPRKSSQWTSWLSPPSHFGCSTYWSSFTRQKKDHSR
jgi:hypothetical protein